MWLHAHASFLPSNAPPVQRHCLQAPGSDPGSAGGSAGQAPTRCIPLSSVSNTNSLDDKHWERGGASELQALQAYMQQHGLVLPLAEVSTGVVRVWPCIAGQLPRAPSPPPPRLQAAAAAWRRSAALAWHAQHGHQAAAEQARHLPQLLVELDSESGMAGMRRRFRAMGQAAALSEAGAADQPPAQPPIPAFLLAGGSRHGAAAVAAAAAGGAAEQPGRLELEQPRSLSQPNGAVALPADEVPLQQGQAQHAFQPGGAQPGCEMQDCEVQVTPQGAPRRRAPIVWQPPPTAEEGQPAPHSEDELRRLSTRFLRFHCPGPQGPDASPPLSGTPDIKQQLEQPPRYQQFGRGFHAAAVGAPVLASPPFPPGFDGTNGLGRDSLPPALPSGSNGSLIGAAGTAAGERSVIALPGSVGLRIRARMPSEPGPPERPQAPHDALPMAATFPGSPPSSAQHMPSLWGAHSLLSALAPAAAAAAAAGQPASPAAAAAQHLLYQQALALAPYAAAAQQSGALPVLPGHLPAVPGLAPGCFQGTAPGPPTFGAAPSLPNGRHPSPPAAGLDPRLLLGSPRARPASPAAFRRPQSALGGSWRHEASPGPRPAGGWRPSPFSEPAPSRAGRRASRLGSRPERRRSRSRSRSRGASRTERPRRRSPARAPSRGRAGRLEPAALGDRGRQRQRAASRAGGEEGREPSRGRSKRRCLRSKSRRRSSSPERQPPRPALEVPSSREGTPDVQHPTGASPAHSPSPSPAARQGWGLTAEKRAAAAGTGKDSGGSATWDPTLAAEAQAVQRLSLRGPMPLESLFGLVDLPHQLGPHCIGEEGEEG